MKRVDNIEIVKATYENTKELVTQYYHYHKQDPFLAKNFTFESLLKDIAYLIDNGMGSVFLQNNVPVGYLLGYKIKRLFFQEPGIYTPDFAVYYENDSVLYRLLEEYYREMKKANFSHHAMTFLTPIQDDFLIQLGYGLRVMDGVRFPQKNIKNDSLVSIDIASIHDFAVLLPLFTEHLQYMSNSPIFLEASNPEEELLDILNEVDTVVFKIRYMSEVIGFSIIDKLHAPGGKYFKDNETLGIKGTHILSQFQNMQIGSKYIELLDNYCIENGFSRLAVDFESMNLLAFKFWSKQFHISAKTYLKYIGK
jgi:ribosomal protein S18 acetylase RimI-like enzyme